MFAILDDSLVFFYGFPSSKVGIFVECLTKCYNPDKGGIQSRKKKVWKNPVGDKKRVDFPDFFKM